MVLSEGNESVLFSATFYLNSTYGIKLGIAVDGTIPSHKNTFAPYASGPIPTGAYTGAFHVNLHTEGLHSCVPVIAIATSSAACYVYLTMSSSPYVRSTCLTASILC